MEFLSPGSTGKIGESPSYLIECRVVKIGKNLGFTEGIIIDEINKHIICKGTHTKCFINSQYKF